MKRGLAPLAAGGFAFVLTLWAFPAPAARQMREADVLCEKAERAEQDAQETERRAAERERFLRNRNIFGAPPAPSTAPSAGAAAQDLRAQVTQARAMLPVIRQAAAAAYQNRGLVPGLGEYMNQMEGNLASAISALEVCLNNPDGCAPPSFYCPAPPSIAVFNKNVVSADMIRRIQDDFRRAGNMAYQACVSLKAEAGRQTERVRQERQAASMRQNVGASGGSGPVGDTELYYRRAASLRRQAKEARLSADRLSGVAGYCAARGRPEAGAEKTREALEALKAAAGRKGAGPALPPDAKVIDLKAVWASKGNKGPVLKASDVPLPKAEAGGGTFFGKVDDYLYEHLPGYGKAKDYLVENVPWWWYKAKSLYREADEQVELTEFIKSRPKELVKDIATEFVESSFGRFGKSLTTAYKITSAVKSTSDEVGEILKEAPGVLARGSASDARYLSGKAGLVPVKFGNDLFDDVSGKFPPPRYRKPPVEE